MAIKAKDEKHAAQIEAGVTGRKRGHDFEKLIANRINLLQPPFKPLNISGHLFERPPEISLLSYICHKLSLEPPIEIKAFSTGGHATGEGGDDFLLDGGMILKRAKSDLILQIKSANVLAAVYGVSVKTCSKSSPTNDQLYCSTAEAFCNLLASIEIKVSDTARKALKMFCGDIGFRPMDSPLVSSRLNSERWFWEELPIEAQQEWASVLTRHQSKITHLLLSKGYKNDPYPPSFVLHQTCKYESWDKVEVALFTIEELVELSCKAGGFSTTSYTVKKGRFKDPSTTHQAPRFGFVQFQRLGNTQNATQLQFNLQAGYFYKLPLLL